MKTGFLSRGAVALLAGCGIAVSVSPAAAQNQVISSAANQTFSVGDPSTPASAITVTDNNGKFKPGSDIYFVIPAGLSMSWDTTVATVTLTGSAAGKVSTTPTYSGGGCVQLAVLSNFTAGDAFTVSGLKFTTFTATGGPASLDLGLKACNSIVATDDKTKTIVPAAPTVSSAASQTFVVGDPATAASTLTITDATTPTITAANDIRVRIPTGFSMTWNTGLTTATIGGGAAAKVSGTVSYENSGQVLVLNVTSNFAGSDQITISGLQFTGFTAASAASPLQLVVSGSAGGATAATDDKTKTIVARTYGAAVSPHTTTASELPSNGTNYPVVFSVKNTGNGSGTDSYDLLSAKRPGTALTTISITGSGVTQGANPDSARLSNLAAGDSVAITVTYSVGSVAAGSQDTLVLTARSVGSPAQKDSGQLRLTVVRPSLTIAKGVNPSGTEPPGTDLTYTLTLTNGGSTSAASVVVVDTLPAAVRFKVGSVANSLPAGVAVTVEYSNNGGATWTYAPASGACAAPAGYDACVDRIRWTLQSPLSATAPDNAGTMQFVAQIR
jgi:trimeric autotransporter adhesin